MANINVRSDRPPMPLPPKPLIHLSTHAIVSWVRAGVQFNFHLTLWYCVGGPAGLRYGLGILFPCLTLSRRLNKLVEHVSVNYA